MSLSDELLSLSSVEMRRRIGTKEVSPVELVEASIARIEALNPTVNAIAATDFAHARKLAISAESAARKGEQLGPLHGLPTGIKDLHETAGLLTTYGSPLYRSHAPAHDAAMVALVRKAGAIILCKTNVPEFGAGANTRNLVWGATGNPFDPRLNAGGSSGGSAVALACDMLPICTGSDTGGSLRIPAAICGVVGFRPSPGVVPMDGRPLGWTPISVLGPMGRSVVDLRLLFSAQIGMDDREPLAFPRDRSIWAGCAWRLQKILISARLARRYGVSSAVGSQPCGTFSAHVTRSNSISARQIGASMSSALKAMSTATATPTRKTRTRSAPTCGPIMRWRPT